MRSSQSSFNEAGGFLPRKHYALAGYCRFDWGFNEAGGFLPRKLIYANGDYIDVVLASMRPGDFSPGNGSTATAWG